MTATHEHARVLEHTPRLELAKLAPEVYRAMVRLETAVQAGIDPTLHELVRIRASQLNHCAFCLEMHTREARAPWGAATSAS